MKGKVLGLTPGASGAEIIHRQLSEKLPGYTLRRYSRYMEYVYPLLACHKYECRSYDLIHCPADYAALLAPRNKPLVITFHNYILDEFMRAYSTGMQWTHYQINLKPLAASALRRARMVTAVSHYVADMVRQELGYTKVVKVIPNGIDCSMFRPAVEPRREKALKVLVSGNLTLRKGAHWLAEIASLLNPGIEMVCASGMRGKNNRLIKHEKIRVIDSCSYADMPGMYQSSDILLMPSVREGFGLAIAEAMACGLPVIASNTSAIPELVHDSQGGFLCEPGDVHGFADRINALSRSEQLRFEMGQYNRALIEEKYNIGTMLKSYEELFESILN